jgi:hypothetical protein
VQQRIPFYKHMNPSGSVVVLFNALSNLAPNNTFAISRLLPHPDLPVGPLQRGEGQERFDEGM